MRRELLGVLWVSSILLSGERCALAQNLAIDHWQGAYPVAELGRFPAGQEAVGVGYIADRETWESVWSGFESAAAPQVNFPAEIVVYARNVDFVNVLAPLSVALDDQGSAEVLAASTLTARPVEDFVYWSAATIPSEGVLQLSGGGQSFPVHIPEPTAMSLVTAAVLALCCRRRPRTKPS